MDDSIVAQDIKKFLENKTERLQHDINTTITTLSQEDLMGFENSFYSDYKYFEEKYANEETFQKQIEQLFGCFPLEYIFSEVQDYMRKKVYLNALYQYIREQDV